MMNGKENLEKIKVCIRVELTLLEKAKFVVHLKTIIEQISNVTGYVLLESIRDKLKTQKSLLIAVYEDFRSVSFENLSVTCYNRCIEDIVM